MITVAIAPTVVTVKPYVVNIEVIRFGNPYREIKKIIELMQQTNHSACLYKNKGKIPQTEKVI